MLPKSLSQRFAVGLVPAAFLLILLIAPVGRLLLEGGAGALAGMFGPLWQDDYLRWRILWTFLQAALTCGLALVLGLPVAWVLARYEFPGRRLIDAAVDLPVALPTAVAGISLAAIREFSGKIPLLGVCLGHQSIGEAFGGKVVHAKQLMHGKVSPVHHTSVGVFRGLPNPVTCTRYHSLAIERESLPDCFEITAWTDDGEIMGVRHKTLAVEGVQFHPESILTEHGHDMLKNFLTR